MSEGQVKRAVYLNGEINAESSLQLKADLLRLDSEDQSTPIELHIDSPGGAVMEAQSIVDTINSLHAPVHTICHDLCVGAAAMVYAAGKQGSRTASSNATFAFPDVGAAFSGNAGELPQFLKVLREAQSMVTAVFAATTGHSPQEAGKLFSHGKAYSAAEAKQAGLVDRIFGFQPA